MQKNIKGDFALFKMSKVANAQEHAYPSVITKSEGDCELILI